MSLDVWLISGKEKKTCYHCDSEYYEDVCDFDYNITHNLSTMAGKAGIYQHLWRPEELGISKASELIDPLTVGLADLKGRPDYFKEFNPPNGWGNYDNLVAFVEKYLEACMVSPNAEIGTSK